MEPMDRQEEWYAAHIPLRDQVIADVGANVGRLSQFFWDASGGTSRVISIEPLVENVVAIRERIRAAAAARWTVEACAASSRSGTVSLYVAPHEAGGFNSVVGEGKGVRKVRCRPLAALVPDATVVKLDIEGHEYEVLEQALPRLGSRFTPGRWSCTRFPIARCNPRWPHSRAWATASMPRAAMRRIPTVHG